MRSDRSEFPIEVTITRIDLPGPATFTGFVRDITERRAAESALSASRARLVETAATERRRLERNLHDGAQQYLNASPPSFGSPQCVSPTGRMRSDRS
jgi:signal transduction histidine kinase